MSRFCKSLIFSAVLIWSMAAYGHNHIVALEDVAQRLTEAQPGDTIFIKDGRYADRGLKWKGCGLPDKPVVIIPLNQGKVVLTGKSSLKIYGSGLEVSSLVFKDGYADKGSVIEFRNGDELANYCRLTDCVIDSYNPIRRDIQCTYVNLYGRHNRVDGCSFLGKKNLGVTLVVMLNHAGCLDNRHIIENNYFGPRPVYGSNGAETIRVGTSQQCLMNSRTIIRNNFFHKCNGEVEVISIKSSENIIEGNVLYECEGVMALRHGDRNIARDNTFIGNGLRNTGGIRIVGENQEVCGNQFFGLDGSRFFSALALMNAVPNSLPNRYIQVKRAHIHDNLFVDCKALEFGTGNDYERTLPPVDIRFTDNVIYNKSADKAYDVVSDVSGVVFKGNKAVLSDNAVIPEGFRGTGLDKPVPPSFESLVAGMGARWYQTDSREDHDPKTITVNEGEDIVKVVSSAPAGAIIELTGETYEIESAMKVSVPLTIRSAKDARPAISFTGRSADYMILLCDGADLTVQGITFSGKLSVGRSLSRGAICTEENMIQPYNLCIEDCTFSEYGESNFVPIRGLKGTFAEKAIIRRCHFEDLSGDAISFAAELDDKGRYNVDDIYIEDCTFHRILGVAVNIYRGGSDESTAGPYVYVRDNRFTDCCNKIRGSVIKAMGAQVLEIVGNSFTDSGLGGYSIRIDEAPWDKVTIRSNTFRNSGKTQSNGL